MKKRIISMTLAVVLAFALLPVVGSAQNASAATQSNTGGVTAFVTRLYNICLGRQPDAYGLEAWVQRLESGAISGTEAAQGFMFSQEMANKRLSGSEYVEILYNAILGRGSDPYGKSAWLDRIRGGMTRHGVFAGFADSVEFRSICASYGINAGDVSKLKEVQMPAPNAPPPRNPQWTDDFDPVTGWDMMEKLGAGIILLETWTEQQWSNKERIEEWHIQAVAQKGFTSITIESCFYDYMDETAVIEPLWLDRVQQIVGWALDAGLNVVLADAHNREFYRRACDAAILGGDYEEARFWLCSMWSQIAERFKNYPEELVFRLMHEPNLVDVTGDWISIDGNISFEFCDVIDMLNADVLEVIRNSGGNNDKRVVALGTPGGEAEALPYMNPPDDDYIMYHVFHGWYLWHLPPGDGTRQRMLSCIEDKLSNGIPIMFQEFCMEPDDTVETLEAAFSDNIHLGIPSFFWNGCPGIFNEPVYGDWVTGEAYYMVYFLDMTTGEWINEDILEAYFAMYGLTPNPGRVEIPAPEFPYEPWESTFRQGPNSDHWHFYRLPISIRNHATHMIVEFEGKLDNYILIRNYPAGNWQNNNSLVVEKNSGRITEEEDRLVIDIRGFELDTLSFCVWDEATKENVTRIYFDGPR